MAEMMSNKYGKDLEYDLVPSSGGAFEISLDGKLVYSKHKTGCFPEQKEIDDIMAAVDKSRSA